MVIAETYSVPHALVFYLSKKSILRKIVSVLPTEKFLSLVLPRNTIWLQHLIIQFTLYHLSSGHLWKVKSERKFQTFSSKSGHGHLQEVIVYKRFQIQWLDLKMFGILENWSLRRGCHLWEVVPTRGSTVIVLLSWLVKSWPEAIILLTLLACAWITIKFNV